MPRLSSSPSNVDRLGFDGILRIVDCYTAVRTPKADDKPGAVPKKDYFAWVFDGLQVDDSGNPVSAEPRTIILTFPDIWNTPYQNKYPFHWAPGNAASRNDQPTLVGLTSGSRGNCVYVEGSDVKSPSYGGYAKFMETALQAGLPEEAAAVMQCTEWIGAIVRFGNVTETNKKTGASYTNTVCKGILAMPNCPGFGGGVHMVNTPVATPAFQPLSVGQPGVALGGPVNVVATPVTPAAPPKSDMDLACDAFGVLLSEPGMIQRGVSGYATMLAAVSSSIMRSNKIPANQRELVASAVTRLAQNDVSGLVNELLKRYPGNLTWIGASNSFQVQ